MGGWHGRCEGEIVGECVKGERGDGEQEGGRGILKGSLLIGSLWFEATDTIESRDGAHQVLRVILGIQKDGTE